MLDLESLSVDDVVRLVEELTAARKRINELETKLKRATAASAPAKKKTTDAASNTAPTATNAPATQPARQETVRPATKPPTRRVLSMTFSSPTRPSAEESQRVPSPTPGPSRPDTSIPVAAPADARPPCSPTPPPPAPTSNQPNLHSCIISNLPLHARTPKGLSPYLSRIHNISIHNIMPLRSGQVLVKSTDPELLAKLNQLKQILEKSIAVVDATDRRSRQPSTPKEPSLSCVITGVDKDVTVEEIQEHLARQGIQYKSVWRIKSRRTNEETRLVRVVTNSKSALDRLLSDGVVIYYRRHRTEPSHPISPQPYQCPRCLAFHEPGACRAAIKCRLCAGAHRESQCRPGVKPTKCGNCGGDHPATSFRCPSRPKVPPTPAATAPVRVLKPETAENSPSPSTYDVLRFTTAALINALPDQYSRIQSVLTSLAATIFNTRMAVSYSGTNVHISCTPIRATYSYAAAASTH